MIICGIDPGPDPGVVVLTIQDGVVSRLETLRTEYPDGLERIQCALRMCSLAGVEAFEIKEGTGHKTTTGSSQTIEQIGQIKDFLRGLFEANRNYSRVVRWQRPGQVKPPLPNRTLKLYVDALPSSRHDRDALRHAIYLGLKFRLITPIPTNN